MLALRLAKGGILLEVSFGAVEAGIFLEVSCGAC